MSRWLSVAAFAVLALALAWASCACVPRQDERAAARACLQDIACIVATGRQARAQALLDEVNQ